MLATLCFVVLLTTCLGCLQVRVGPAYQADVEQLDQRRNERVDFVRVFYSEHEVPLDAALAKRRAVGDHPEEREERELAVNRAVLNAAALSQTLQHQPREVSVSWLRAYLRPVLR